MSRTTSLNTWQSRPEVLEHDREIGLSQKIALQQHHQPFHKDLQSSGLVLAVRIKQRHRHWRSTMARHHIQEIACAQVSSNVISGNLYQPHTGKTAGDVGLRIVDRNSAAHPQRVHSPGVDPFPALQAAARRRCIVDGQVRREICGLAWHAMCGEIGGARNVEQRKLANGAGASQRDASDGDVHRRRIAELVVRYALSRL